MTLSKFIAAAALALGLFSQTVAHAQSGIQVGQLNCEVAGGLGFIFGSSKDMVCAFTPANSSEPIETYGGVINKYGLDLGATGRTVILWAVVARESDLYAPGALAGRYVGASAEAAFAAGLGTNVLVGGSAESFALQPVSVSASTGINVAVGLSEVVLTRR
ncbi:MAG: DUF992 domain-containing protein [Ahrensia sp.]|nr:DUF992 domain-containing protein [Ahrensia sp.]